MTLLTRPPMPTGSTPPCPIIERALNEARKRIEVLPEELDEARRRRKLMADALEEEFDGPTYVNGSVAHGDALNPLTDVDLGVIVPNDDGAYGPGSRGPAGLEERAAEALRRKLAPLYPNLRIEWRSRHRSVLVRFGDPVTRGQQDFTADVIVAIDYPHGGGLWIPDYDSWDRSAPQAHTRMIRDANHDSNATFARVMRLLKHWARTHDRPLCSWNIKALGLGIIRGEVTMLQGLQLWFGYAAVELNKGETEDPARVASGPIAIPEKWTRSQVVAELRAAAADLDRAASLEQKGYPALALDVLAGVFKDPKMLPAPDPKDVDREMKRMMTVTPVAAATPAASERPTFPRRAWGE